jgi:hypothetical protein
MDPVRSRSGQVGPLVGAPAAPFGACVCAKKKKSEQQAVTRAVMSVCVRRAPDGERRRPTSADPTEVPGACIVKTRGRSTGFLDVGVQDF